MTASSRDFASELPSFALSAVKIFWLPLTRERVLILIIMGVVGAGKTTVGSLLAQRLGWEFADADSFHSPANVEKIRQGIALSDADRAPWLAALRDYMLRHNAEGKNLVLACSALKQKYRDELCAAGVQFIYLDGEYELIRDRLRARHGHFATESILKSQLADLEKPRNAITVQINKSPQAIVGEIMRHLALPLSYPEAAQK